jgi:oligopeptide/dipeptide ABC transporter ATP-binding protein
LIGSIPVVGEIRDELAVIPGNVPNLVDLPPGCRFAPRCAARVPMEVGIAEEVHPELRTVRPGHDVRCWLYHDPDGGLRPTVARAVADGASAAAASGAATYTGPGVAQPGVTKVAAG